MSTPPYLTAANSSSQLRNWKKQLSPYSQRWKNFTLPDSALLIIDMQNYFLDKNSHAYVPASPAILKNIRRLIDLYRRQKLPIIFTYFAVKKNEPDPINNWWHDTVYDHTPPSQISPALAPQPHEPILRKNSYSSFYQTDLEKILQKHQVKNLVISGVLTNLCCETAAREAFVRNFNVFFLMDGTAAYSEEMHLSTLKNLAYGFATPVSTQSVISDVIPA